MRSAPEGVNPNIMHCQSGPAGLGQHLSPCSAAGRSLPPFPCACRRLELPAAVKPAALAAMVNILAVLPAHAEAGKIFDFNLTLPVMATEFLLCMVFLEKTWFTPVGEVTLPVPITCRCCFSLVPWGSREGWSLLPGS